MLVRDIMTTEIASCTPETTIYEAACELLDADVGSLPVVEDRLGNRLVGMITDRDIVCRCVAADRDPHAITVAELMSRDLETVAPDTTVEECMRRLEERQIRRIPVVDGDGRCCGVVAQADLARHADSGPVAALVREVSEPATEAGAARVR